MAVLDFPSDTSQSPYELNGITYNWDGQKWVAAGTGGGGAGGDLTLQEVTDNGSTTTNGAEFGGNVAVSRPSDSNAAFQATDGNAAQPKFRVTAGGRLTIGTNVSNGPDINIQLDQNGKGSFAGGAIQLQADGNGTFGSDGTSTDLTVKSSDVTAALRASNGAGGNTYLLTSTNHPIFLRPNNANALKANPDGSIYALRGQSGTIPTNGNLDTNASLVLHNQDPAANFAGLSFITRGSADNNSQWLIANEHQGNNSGDLVFRAKTGTGTGSAEYVRFKNNGAAEFAGSVTAADGDILLGDAQNSLALYTQNANATTNRLYVYNNDTGTATIELRGDGTIKGTNLSDGLTTKTMTEVLAGGELWSKSSNQIYPKTNGDNVLIKASDGTTTISLSNNGNISGQQIISGNNPNGGVNEGARLRPNGNLQITNDGGVAINIMNKGDAAQKVSISSNGSATFAGGQASIASHGGLTCQQDGGTALVQLTSNGSIYARGPATGGVVNLINDTTGKTTFSIQGNGNTFIGDDTQDAGGTKITLNAIGNATFAGGQFAIDEVGNVSISRTNDTRFISLNSQGQLVINGAGTGTVFSIQPEGTSNNTVTIDGDGNAVFGSVTENPSDVKFKTQTRSVPTSQLEDIKNLNLKEWAWTEDAPGNEEVKARRNRGLIAQEAELVDPKLVYEVTQDEDNSYKAIDHQVLIMKLLGAVQELSAEVQALKEAN